MRYLGIVIIAMTINLSWGQSFFERGIDQIGTLTELQFVHSEYVNSTKIKFYPVLSWQNLLRFRGFRPGTAIEQDYCLNFFIPSERHQKLGKLVLHQVNKEQNCKDFYFEQNGLLLEKIKTLNLFVDSEKELEIIFKLRLKDASGKSVEKEWEIPLYNLKLSRSYKKYDGSAPRQRLEGVMFLSMVKKEEQSKLKAQSALGNYSDDYNEKGQVKCHDVGPGCKSLTTNICHQCKFGWYQAVSADCLEDGDKFCGIDQCGSSGRPACPRGRFHGSLLPKEVCSEPETYSFCQKGLSPRCNEDQILVCL